MSVRGFLTRLFGPPPRRDLAEMDGGGLARGRRPLVRAGYDAAKTTDDNARHWTGVDCGDADSANSNTVRVRIARRVREEMGNNGQGKGVVLTHANYVVGRGPRLRMLTASKPFNAMVEAKWQAWAKAARLARKLRTAIKSKTTDGESVLIAQRNPHLADEVKLDLRAIETEQMTTPGLAFGEQNKIDGIEFDEFGNATVYTILKRHPGAAWSSASLETERVPAKFVLHLFREDRPGQHRAVSELSSTLGLFAQARRWREATLRAAENVADISLALKTQSAPDDGPDAVAPMSTIDFEKGMMTALPAGHDLFQPKSEQPTATYGEFNASLQSEEARPLSMSRNIAAADSSDYSFSGGRLDHLTYFAAVDTDQADIEDLTLDPLFALWFAEAVLVYGWAVSVETAPTHDWVWPALPKIDDQKTASARQTNLATGATTLTRIYAEDGLDFEDELVTMAADYGVTVDQMRAKLFSVNFSRAGAAPQETPPEPEKQTPKPVNRLPARNGNGKATAAGGLR